MQFEQATLEQLKVITREWSKRPLPTMGPGLLAMELHGGRSGREAGKKYGLATFADGSQLDTCVGRLRNFDISFGFLGAWCL
jgi:hypothetical protein